MNTQGPLPADNAVMAADLVLRLRSTAADAAATAIMAAVPAYGNNPDPDLREEVTAHCYDVFGLVATVLRENRTARMEEFPTTVRTAMRRVEQGISAAEFLQAFRVAQSTMWEQLRAATGSERELREAVLDAVAPLMQVIEVGSSAAIAAHLEAEQYRLADHDRVRRDLIEDLINGRIPAAIPRRALLRAVGLGEGAEYVVVSAVVADDEDLAGTLRAVAKKVRPAAAATNLGIVALRQAELIAVLPTAGVGEQGIREALRGATRELGRSKIIARLGVSAVHNSWAAVSEGYGEARTVRAACPPGGGVVAMTSLAPVDYLILKDDTTARRLIRPAVHRFIVEDLDDGGDYIETVLAFATAALNARAVAERLALHVNSVYNRLDRVMDRTGCDPRRFADLNYLVTAIRLIAPTHPAAWDGWDAIE